MLIAYFTVLRKLLIENVRLGTPLSAQYQLQQREYVHYRQNLRQWKRQIF